MATMTLWEACNIYDTLLRNASGQETPPSFCVWSQRVQRHPSLHRAISLRIANAFLVLSGESRSTGNASGALASRMILLRFRKSFYGGAWLILTSILQRRWNLMARFEGGSWQQVLGPMTKSMSPMPNLPLISVTHSSYPKIRIVLRKVLREWCGSGDADFWRKNISVSVWNTRQPRRQEI